MPVQKPGAKGGRGAKGKTSKKAKPKRVPIAVVFCVFLIVAAVTVFFIFLPTVTGNLKQVKTERPQRPEPETQETPPVSQEPPPQPPRQNPQQPSPQAEASQPPSPGQEGTPPQAAQETPPAQQGTESSSGRPTVTPPVQPAAETRERNIYLMQDRGGNSELVLTRVSRSLKASNSPLRDSINALLSGPTADERSRDLISCIPDGSRLLSVEIEGGTARLDFNEEFRYNTFGEEGGNAQLRQIVWTATEFPNVHNVQILIEGERVEFLHEGILIWNPIGR